MSKISVAINTYNAEQHLQAVLESVKGFDEILICDMHSTDRTLEIAQAYGCTIIYHEHTGIADPARLFAIQSVQHPWVLALDADEVVPARLKEYLYERIQEADCPDGIRLTLKNYFMGHFMRCSYPSYILRFFKKDKVFWPPFVHSQAIVSGKVDSLPKQRKELALIHLANDSVEATLNKTNRYTNHEMVKRADQHYGYFSLLTHSVFRFFKFYILKGACLDGKAGFAYAGLNAFYKFVTIAKIWEAKGQYGDMMEDVEKSRK